MQLELTHVSKTYSAGGQDRIAVDDVSWSAEGGEVFGVLGPNGAGKTSMLRMVLDIIRPDSGHILIDNDSSCNSSKNFRHMVGYLPEERGLYRNRSVLETLTYFAALKGISASIAKERAKNLLARFELSHTLHQKIERLSKGMGQKIQIISCILHEPKLLILDEPFSGLDPINVRMVRDLIVDLKSKGVLVCLSTHMMAEVEALCDRVTMIHQGRQVIYGKLSDIRKSHARFQLKLDREAQVDDLESVESVNLRGDEKYINLKPGLQMQDFLREIVDKKRALQRVEEAQAKLEDIFISIVQGHS